MTAWLPIETYKYDGSWGLFRGGQIEDDHRNYDETMQFKPPFVVGKSDHKLLALDDCCHHTVEICEYDNGAAGPIYYDDPTEWLPLSILDYIPEHAVTAARFLL